MIPGQLIVDGRISGVTISGRKMGQVKQAANSQGAISDD
jgi:dihydroxyacid dehydratase/phosphogluconate dehydratase